MTTANYGAAFGLKVILRVITYKIWHVAPPSILSTENNKITNLHNIGLYPILWKP
jgi:hypothetical protein